MSDTWLLLFVLTGRKTCFICLIFYNLSHIDISELALSMQTTNGLIYDHPLALLGPNQNSHMCLKERDIWTLNSLDTIVDAKQKHELKLVKNLRLLMENSLVRVRTHF